MTAIYEGPKTASGETLHPGFPFGGEDVDGNGWGSWLVGGKNMGGPGMPNAAFAFGIGVMRYFVYQNEAWDYEGYGFETWEQDSTLMQATLNANSP